jgi:hypothetical protein
MSLFGGGNKVDTSGLEAIQGQMADLANKQFEFGKQQYYTYADPTLREIYQIVHGYQPSQRDEWGDPFGSQPATKSTSTTPGYDQAYATYAATANPFQALQDAINGTTSTANTASQTAPASTGSKWMSPLESRMFAPAIEQYQNALTGQTRQLADYNLPTVTKSKMLETSRNSLMQNLSSSALNTVNGMVNSLLGQSSSYQQGATSSAGTLSGAASIENQIVQLKNQASQQNDQGLLGGIAGIASLAANLFSGGSGSAISGIMSMFSGGSGGGSGSFSISPYLR